MMVKCILTVYFFGLELPSTTLYRIAELGVFFYIFQKTFLEKKLIRSRKS